MRLAEQWAPRHWRASRDASRIKRVCWRAEQRLVADFRDARA
jgi:hypothetical protein